MGNQSKISLQQLVLFNRVVFIKKNKLNMSLTFFHPYSMKPCYLRRKPMKINFDNFSIFPFIFDDCLKDQTGRLKHNNQLEDNENNFVTKIELEGFESKDINLELSCDKRKIKIAAKNENKIEKDGLRSYTLKEYSKEINLPENI